MQKDPVRPKDSVDSPHAEEVENVDGMDVTANDEAGGSEKATESSGEDAVESQEVQGETVEARRTEPEEDVEAQATRAAKAQNKPSQREIDEHDLTHCPYRAWCEACVRG